MQPLTAACENKLQGNRGFAWYQHKLSRSHFPETNVVACTFVWCQEKVCLVPDEDEVVRTVGSIASPSRSTSNLALWSSLETVHGYGIPRSSSLEKITKSLPAREFVNSYRVKR